MANHHRPPDTPPNPLLASHDSGYQKISSLTLATPFLRLLARLPLG